MTFEEAADALVAVGQAFHARGWAPATSGNYSARIDDGRIAITVSGAHKGRMTRGDIMLLDAGDPRRPSAETALHLAVYRAFPEVRSVLHSHAAISVGLGRASGDDWTIAGHELLKALPGIDTHDTSVAIPIVENSQDIAAIERAVMPRLGNSPAFMIRGHGMYGWGRSIAEAERVIEALEWLAEAELAERRFRA
ncbi:methylthioribulose-1-phosphate dehydratase [Sphingomonas changbaiensis NBRC 104936]|uniref:Methylthioribulose-1-phosphate dehydratase n=1 Tax=Sphingomonas changbaiensis NBRC 104936 TaxID=1219043 RepID=A0A0E9MLG0_9SPHN|nr:methylthioribulose 1-phosphate dehydratase [Sphingomonas changbaiensis]GAO37955.1 methylthioribulose-1-phosphate dehydratase [Sphingomonas changbaiensis NBRC 104936]